MVDYTIIVTSAQYDKVNDENTNLENYEVGYMQLQNGYKDCLTV